MRLPGWFAACAIGVFGCAFEVEEDTPAPAEKSAGTDETTLPGGMREYRGSPYCALFAPHQTIDGREIESVLVPCPPPAGETYDPREEVLGAHDDPIDPRELTQPADRMTD